MDLIQIYDSEIFPRLDLEKIYNDLNPIDKNRYFAVDCPECKKQKKAVVWKNTGLLICNKGGCGYRIKVTTYINKGKEAVGKEWVECIKEFAEQVGVELPEYEWSYEDSKRYEEKERRQQLLHDFQHITYNALYSSYGNRSRDDLIKRGWNEETTRQYDFGYYHSNEFIKSKLKDRGYTDQEIRSSNICRQDWEGRIVYPIKDLHHNIINFFAHDTTGQSEEKYLYMKDGSLAVPFNLNNAAGRDLIVVEGLFDVLTPDSNGFKNIIGIGGINLKEGQIDSLHKAKINSLTLLLDNDKFNPNRPLDLPAGTKATIDIINKLKNDNLNTFVIPPEALGDSKDPDEFVRKNGPEALQDILNNKSIHGFRYIAQHIINKNNKSGNWNDNEVAALLKEAENFAASITNKNRQLDLAAYFHDEIYTIPIRDDAFDVYEQNIKEAAERTILEEARNKIGDFVKNGKLQDANNEIIALANNIQSVRSNSEPFAIHFIDEYNNLLLTDAPEMPVLVSVIESAEIKAFIPKGIVGSVVGSGGIGKTHWLTQLALSIVTQAPFLSTYGDNNSKYITRTTGGVALILGENSNDDIHRLLRKIITGTFGNNMSKEVLQKINRAYKLFAPISVTGTDASFIDRNGNPSLFYKILLNDLIDKEPAEGWDLIVLDPASRFLGPDAETDNAAATMFISLLENIIRHLKGNPTILLGHHMNKNAVGKANTDETASRGSSALTNGVRWQLNIEPAKDDNIDKTKIKMKVTKSNHTGPSEQILNKDETGYLTIENNQQGKDYKAAQSEERRSESSSDEQPNGKEIMRIEDVKKIRENKQRK
ncbi:MAG TPA: AAA family ATPase [Candidatus Babeliales bacterium]|jgi:DNA primase catalytic core|nr:AAA family ATPase [Candidatus Babeliales bacterium]